MSLVVLACYGEKRPMVPQAEQALWLAAHALDLVTEQVRMIECAGPTDYEQAIRRHWGLNDLLIWERDMVPTVEMVERLIRCPEGRCAQTYLYHAGTITDVYRKAVPSAWVAETLEGEHSSYPVSLPVQVGQQWADRVGLGLTHITAGVQRRIGSLARLEEGDWRTLDRRLMTLAYQAGVRWHVHWPLCEHRHSSASDLARGGEVRRVEPMRERQVELRERGRGKPDSDGLPEEGQEGAAGVPMPSLRGVAFDEATKAGTTRRR